MTSKLKRFSDGGWMEPSDNGEWCNADEAEAEIERLRNEAEHLRTTQDARHVYTQETNKMLSAENERLHGERDALAKAADLWHCDQAMRLTRTIGGRTWRCSNCETYRTLPDTNEEAREPRLEIFRSNGVRLVAIMGDGSILYGSNYTPDEAAEVFWKSIASHEAVRANEAYQLATTRCQHSSPTCAECLTEAFEMSKVPPRKEADDDS